MKPCNGCGGTGLAPGGADYCPVCKDGSGLVPDKGGK